MKSIFHNIYLWDFAKKTFLQLQCDRSLWLVLTKANRRQLWKGKQNKLFKKYWRKPQWFQPFYHSKIAKSLSYCKKWHVLWAWLNGTAHLGEMPSYPILLSIVCTFFIENDAEILPTHYAWKIAFTNLIHKQSIEVIL